MQKMKEKNLDTRSLQPAGNDARKKKKVLEHWKIIAFYLLAYDIIAINFSYFLGLWLRFDFHFSRIPEAVSYTHLDVYKRQLYAVREVSKRTG